MSGGEKMNSSEVWEIIRDCLLLIVEAIEGGQNYE